MATNVYSKSDWIVGVTKVCELIISGDTFKWLAVTTDTIYLYLKFTNSKRDKKRLQLT